jgi:hypothetical protein
VRLQHEIPELGWSYERHPLRQGAGWWALARWRGAGGVACGHEDLRWQRKGQNWHQWQGHDGCKTDWSPKDWWRGRGHWADGGGITGVWHGATNDLRRQWG